MGVAFLASMGFTSCKKDYTCTCTYTDSDGKQTEKTEIKDAKKKDAQDACDAMSLLYSLGGGSCDLD